MHHNKLMSTMPSSYRPPCFMGRHNVKCQWRQFSWNKNIRPLIPHPAKSYKNKTPVKGRQLFQQEMFKGWNIMWKFRWVKIGVFMIHPCCSVTVAISLILSLSILQSALSLYIATVCSRFSRKPVHHPISLALFNAWLAKRCICGDFMNKSAAINFWL